MGLKTSPDGNSHRAFAFGTIGRVLYPLTSPSMDRKVKLTTAVRAAVADMKK
jgi:hypothetical protein